ncbi:MAG: hypothetical protein ACFFD4_10115 [Candidatus Odinarchaeota archaeon]
MTEAVTNKSEEGSLQKMYSWLLYKFNYGFGTYKGLITFTIVWEFCIVLFLTTFSEPVKAIIGAPLFPVQLPEAERIGRIIMLYHSIAVPFLVTVTYYVLEICDVREKWGLRVKWLIFPGSILTSASGISFAYILQHNWIVHGIFIAGLSITFLGGVFLLIGVFPTGNFPEHNEKGPYLFGINFAQVALALLIFCILISTILGAAAGAYFGNGFEAFLAEHILRLEHDIFERAIIGHLHIMLALICTAVLLVVFRYTFPKQEGRWYFLSIIITIPGMLIMSVGAWLVLTGLKWVHYLIYAGSGVLLLAAAILALAGWNRTSKDVLGSSYETASWVVRAKAVFKDPVKFGLYFQFIWVNIVMTLPGIFLAFSLEADSILTRILKIEAFREGPEFIELTVARGHWHVLATLTAIIILLLTFDHLDVQGRVRQIMGWLLNIGSIIAFGFAVILMFYPHFDPTANMDWAILPIDLGITLFVAGIALFCLHQLVEILKGKKDVLEWSE